MRGWRGDEWDAGQGDLFISPERAARGFDLAALPSLDLTASDDPVVLLRQLQQRVGQLADLIEATRDEVLDAGGARERAREAAAVATVDACARVASLSYAQQLRAITLVHDGSSALLADSDASPSARRSAPDGASRGRYPSRGSLTASVIGPVLGLSAGGAHTQVRRALALRDQLPHARQRLIDGDWGEFHLALALQAIAPARLDDETVGELDAALHQRHERISPTRITTGIERWLARRGLPTRPEPADHQGPQARRVWFGPLDLFGMRTLGGYFRATDVTAIEGAVHAIATTAADDDPRTVDQRVADSFMGLFFGPAALAPAVTDQLDIPSPEFDGPEGYVVADEQQAATVSATWQTIRMLLATLDLTTCAPPQAHLDITVDLNTLAQLHAGLNPGHPDNGLDELARAYGVSRSGIPGAGHHYGPPSSGPPGSGPPGSGPPGSGPPGSGPHPGPSDTEPVDTALSDTDPLDVCLSGTAPPDARPLDGVSLVGVPNDAGRPTADGPAGAATPVADESRMPDPRARAVGIGPLSHDLLMMLLRHDTRMRRVMLGPVHGQPINIGRSRYVPSPAMATRVRLRDKHCRFPGCNRPAVHPAGRSADIDHLHPFSHGGDTADANHAVLCEEHHKIKHHATWTPVLHEDGSITWRNNRLGLSLLTRPGDQT